MCSLVFIRWPLVNIRNNSELQFQIYVGGQEALDQWLKYQEALVWCVMQNFESGEIEREIRAKEKTGDLDLVFKKYCG